MALELEDGSRIVGIPAATEIPFRTEYADLRLALKLIDRMEISQAHGYASVVFRNGDTLRGSMGVERMAVRAIFGVCSIAVTNIVAMAVTLAGEAGSALPNGLVLYCAFDGDEGRKVTDRSGRGNDGRVEGGQWIERGKRGGAFELDGEDDYIRVPRSENLRFGRGSLTVCAWAKMGLEVEGRHATLVGTNWEAQHAIELRITPDGRGEFLVATRSPNVGQVTGKDVMTDGRWRHVVGIRDAEKGQARLYIDGRKAGEAEDRSGLLDTTVDWGIGTIVGSQNHPNTDVARRFLRGAVDEVMIFDRALTEAEVRQLYDSGK